MTLKADAFLNGKTLNEIDFRNRFHAVVLAVRRDKKIRRANLQDDLLRAEDSLLVQGSREHIESLCGEAGLACEEVEQNVLIEDYQLNERLMVLTIPLTSPVGNKALKESRLAEVLGMRVLCIIRKNGAVRMPDANEILLPEDQLVMEGRMVTLEEHMDKIFDPYFSTKQRGTKKGMGLGLTTAYAIVRQHQGHFQIDSSPGAGSAVYIYIPVESGTKQMDRTIPSAKITRSPVKRVLVMDDEEMLRNLVRQMLLRLDCMVETVKDGLEAIAKYQQKKDSGEPFDAVILDLTLKGGMGGEQTIRYREQFDDNFILQWNRYSG